MVQVLHISNGDTINLKLSQPDNRLQTLLTDFSGNDAGLLDELFLSSLARYPAEHEKTAMLKLLSDSEAADRRIILEDIAWSIFSSREFLFNH